MPSVKLSSMDAMRMVTLSTLPTARTPRNAKNRLEGRFHAVLSQRQVVLRESNFTSPLLLSSYRRAAAPFVQFLEPKTFWNYVFCTTAIREGPSDQLRMLSA